MILGFLLVAIASASYFTGHFVITSDTNKLISSSLPWRQQEVMLDLAFPHRVDRIVTVIEATTPEAADRAADALVNELSPRSDVIRTISRVDGGEFFERNGILFRSLDEVRRDTSDLISAQPFLGTLAADPTLRGAPSGHTVSVREVILAAGAEFIVAVCGDIMRMPGLPKVPAAESIRLNDKGQIEGLF